MMIAEIPPKKRLYVIGLVAVLGSDFALRNVLLPEHAEDIHIATALLVEWLVLLALLAFWIPKLEGTGLASVGLGKFTPRYLWMSGLTYLTLSIAWIGSGFVLGLMGLEGLRSLLPMIKDRGLPIRLGLFMTGALLEEIFYRGYAIERVLSLTGRGWLAGLLSWITFTFVHLKFFGLGPTLDVGVLSAGLVVLYLRERSIWPCVFLHGMNDAFGFLVASLIAP